MFGLGTIAKVVKKGAGAAVGKAEAVGSAAKKAIKHPLKSAGNAVEDAKDGATALRKKLKVAAPFIAGPVAAPVLKDKKSEQNVAGKDRKEKNFLTDAMKTGKTVLFAHRGDHQQSKSHEKENTIQALERAAKDGSADAVEMDVQKLKDGTLVVYHDDNLAAGTNKGRPLKDLSKKDLADQPQIPTLEEWSKRAGQLDIGVMLELKGSGYEREAIETLKQHVKPEKIAAMSFDPEAVKGVHKADPSVPVGLVARRSETSWEKLNPFVGRTSVVDQVNDLGFKPDFVELVKADLEDDSSLDTLAKQGIGVLAGKEDPKQQLALSKDPRVNGILTDQPTQARKILEGKINFDPVTGAMILGDTPNPAMPGYRLLW